MTISFPRVADNLEISKKNSADHLHHRQEARPALQPLVCDDAGMNKITPPLATPPRNPPLWRAAKLLLAAVSVVFVAWLLGPLGIVSVLILWALAKGVDALCRGAPWFVLGLLLWPHDGEEK
jgi:hypothetical protein